MSAEAIVAKHRQRTPEEDDLTHYGERNGQIHQRPRHPQFPENENCEGKDDMEHFGSNTEVQPASLGHYDTSVSVWNVLSGHQVLTYFAVISIAYMGLKVKRNRENPYFRVFSGLLYWIKNFLFPECKTANLFLNTKCNMF